MCIVKKKKKEKKLKKEDINRFMCVQDYMGPTINSTVPPPHTLTQE